MILKEIKRFLSFVEIQTKLATIFPFLVALAYVFYTTGTINIISTALYIVAALIVDMAITATNQHFDKREEKGETPHYSNLVSISIIIIMYTIAAVLGLYLASIHGLVVFLAGVFCFMIGIMYTFGPIPISKSVYGEIAAGFVAGFLIMFIVVSINNPLFMPVVAVFNQYNFNFTLNIDIIGLLSFGLVTLPAVFSSANILLANNICDAKKDRAYRYTLTHHIGNKKALMLFAALYYASYLAIVVAVILQIIPAWSLLTLITFVPVQKNISKFFKQQIKDITFVLSVRNYSIILFVFALSITIDGFI